MLLQTTQAGVVEQKLAVDLVHAVFDVDDELQALVEVLSELVLGLAAASADVT